MAQRLDLALFDDERGHMYKHEFPKHTALLLGQGDPRYHYDLNEERILALIDALDTSRPDPYASLINRRGDFVQCYRDPAGFCVEWRENYGFAEDGRFDHWRAQDAVLLARLAEPDKPVGRHKETEPELLPAEAMRTIFRAFLARQPRPEQFHWRWINEEI